MTPAEIRAARCLCGPGGILTEDQAASASRLLEGALDHIEGVCYGDEPVLLEEPTTRLQVYQALVDWCRRHGVEDATLEAGADPATWRRTSFVWVGAEEWTRLGVRPTVSRGDTIEGVLDGVRVRVSRAAAKRGAA